MAKASSSILATSPNASGTLTSLKPISDMLATLVAASALTKTSDSGQIVWSNITATQSAAVYGYEVYRFADTLDSTFPIFMKFTYGQIVVAIGSPLNVWIEIGTGSDGAGNITNSSGRTAFKSVFAAASNTFDTTSRTCWASSGDGYLNVFGGFNNQTGSAGTFFLSIERTRDASGTITGDGVSVVMSSNYSQSSQTFYRVGAVATSFGAYIPYAQGSFSAAYGNTAALFSTSCFFSPPIMNRGSSYTVSPQFDGTSYITTAMQAFTTKISGTLTGVVFGDDVFGGVGGSVLPLYVAGATHNYVVSTTGAAMPYPAGPLPPLNSAMTYYQMFLLPLFRWE